ncbi:MAG: FAD-dependent oxidoreductase [Bacteroidota bacterium]
MKTYDFVIAGAGIFGLSAALELTKRKYKVAVLNPNTIPHHLAASTDISKIVRTEYGSDELYFRMADICIDRWHDWNDLFEEKLYHEAGFLMLCGKSLGSPEQAYEKAGFDLLKANGYQPELLGSNEIGERFPAINSNTYPEAVFNPRGGFVESARVIEKLATHLRSVGADLYERQTLSQLIITNGKISGVQTTEGDTFSCDHLIIAAGAHSPVLLPELKPYIKATGHPVFWLKPEKSAKFSAPQLPVFTADISNTGWYGMPFSDKNGVVKIGRHTNGLELDPDLDDRIITGSEIQELREFLAVTFPDLANSPVVYTRRCLYTDTLDGHFWIDNHPEIKGLTVSTGGSGHGMKMGPVLGEITADAAEGRVNEFGDRFKWRHLTEETVQLEEARFIDKG